MYVTFNDGQDYIIGKYGKGPFLVIDNWKSEFDDEKYYTIFVNGSNKDFYQHRFTVVKDDMSLDDLL